MRQTGRLVLPCIQLNPAVWQTAFSKRLIQIMLFVHCEYLERTEQQKLTHLHCLNFVLVRAAGTVVLLCIDKRCSFCIAVPVFGIAHLCNK